ncbi:RtcB family protein [Limibacter armeniacum]|uniref:RtcB family protein n=1 Tax=Limibacter armeniacum TaxID=466084 RepID=UPI002FE69E2A
MATNKLRGKELEKLGFPKGRVSTIILEIFQSKRFKKHDKEEKLSMLQALIDNREDFRYDPDFRRVVEAMEGKTDKGVEYELEDRELPCHIFGKENIQDGALRQMNAAMKLPITAEGALMPDAHQGYGLPIGGVLATENAVIPYGVGVDIGCRMCLSVYPMDASILEGQRGKLRNILLENTRFGKSEFELPLDHEVLERKEFQEIGIVRSLKDKAYCQIGSSGGGNHFVEFGITEILDPENEFGVPVGKYLAVLSHSGSRGLGAYIAQHYTRIAMDACHLPGEAKHLAWLDLNTEAGQEYWLAMNLAGDYASACHHQIHYRIGKKLGEKPLFKVENHHNFAWKEQLADGREVIVHRKGATPAKKGELGVIPGSMTQAGFIVRGRGNAASLNSASHGAGRLLSRTMAKNTISQSEVNKLLDEHGITLIGSGLDEAPQAYKDIRTVMRAQTDLVDVIGTFKPKIVRMSDDDR